MGWSLRHRLLRYAILATLATLLIGASAVYLVTIKGDQVLHDVWLNLLSKTLLAYAEHELQESEAGEVVEPALSELLEPLSVESLNSRYRYQVWTRAGRMLLSNPTEWGSGPFGALNVASHADALIEGQLHRVVNQRSDDRELFVRVAKPIDELDPAVLLLESQLLLLLLLPFGLVTGLTWWTLQRSFRSIDESAAQLRRRAATDLDQIQVSNPPTELAPLLDAVNEAFGRVRTMLSIERGFTARAAHELASPLAGLRAHAQLGLAARSPEEWKESMTAVMHGVDRAAHLLDQMLDLAKVESHAAAVVPSDVDVEAVCRGLLEDFSSLLILRRQRVSLDFAVTRLAVHEAGFTSMMRNLISNAVRYAPVAGNIAITTRGSAAGISVIVDDSGPGIAAKDRQKVFDRFERLGRTEPYGTGLGMGIIQAVVTAHQASITLQDSPLGGLRVVVEFPPAVATTTAA